MHDYIISCGSTADLRRERFKKRDIRYICYHYALNGKTYTDDLGLSMPIADFYKAMAAGADTKTTQINTEEFVDYFIPLLEEGKDVLHLCLSSGITGVFNAANMARDILKERFPERRLYIVDSLAASAGYGLIMDKLADLRDGGMGLEELRDYAEARKLEAQHWFFSTDLTFYVKGGRISKASGWFGTALQICPLMNVDKDGRLIPRFKVRTKKRVIREIVNQMERYAKDGLDYSDSCFISNAGCPEDAEEVRQLVEERFPRLKGRVEVSDIGTTIGSHTGPGTVALFFWGAKRVD